MKPKIALLIDRPDWAFANIARNLERHLSDRFEFDIIPHLYSGDLARSMLATKESDLVHFFWRNDLRMVLSDDAFRWHVKSMFGNSERFFHEYVDRTRMSTAVYDHQFLDEDSIARFKRTYHQAQGYYVCSNKLNEIYAGIDSYPNPSAVLEDGVDLSLFQPKNLQRLRRRKRQLVVGWAGNSLWGDPSKDPKGFHTLLKPALAKLQSRGLPVEGRFADRVDGLKPHTQMVDYYSSIDVYVCPSLHEGTPNPVLEAMACGVPVISTDVGVVRDVFGPEQSRLILDDRSVDALAGKLTDLVDNPRTLTELSQENIESIQDWDWSVKTQGFAEFFTECLDERPTLRSEAG